MTIQQPLLLTVKEVSELLRIHRPKVYVLIKNGNIKGVKIGSDWRIRRDSVEELVGPIPNSFFSNRSDQLSESEESQETEQFISEIERVAGEVSKVMDLF